MTNPLNKKKMDKIDWLFIFGQIGAVLSILTGSIIKYLPLYTFAGIVFIVSYFIVAHKHNRQFKIIPSEKITEKRVSM